MAAIIEVKYFNAFVLRKTYSPGDVPSWGGSRGDNTYNQTITQLSNNGRAWFVEESRIKGGYNNPSTAYGVKAYLIEEEPAASNRVNALIYSGIFNSKTGINNTNQFSVAEDITKSVDPANGSIQRLYAEDSNLIVFQENKVSRALIDKDAIYSAEGGGSVTSSNVVIGQIVPYAGNYGISKNPESFAVYGYRKYFADKNRNAVLRLSQDGITEISNYGMLDFFRDNLSAVGNGKVVGGWDVYTKQYLISIQKSDTEYKTLSFDEEVKGWTSFYSYMPAHMFSLKGRFYTVPKNTDSITSGVWLHNIPDYQVNRSNFYGTQYKSRIKFVFNPKVSVSKNFKTINYEGSNGWQVDSFVSDYTGTGMYNIGNPGNYETLNEQDTSAFIYSYNEGTYDDYGNEFPALLTPPVHHAGFTRKENKYTTNLVNNSPAHAGEVVYDGSMSGIKGYFAVVTMSTDATTDIGKMKELFAVSSEYVDSSY